MVDGLIPNRHKIQFQEEKSDNDRIKEMKTIDTL